MYVLSDETLRLISDLTSHASKGAFTFALHHHLEIPKSKGNLILIVETVSKYYIIGEWAPNIVVRFIKRYSKMVHYHPSVLAIQILEA